MGCGHAAITPIHAPGTRRQRAAGTDTVKANLKDFAVIWLDPTPVSESFKGSLDQRFGQTLVVESAEKLAASVNDAQKPAVLICSHATFNTKEVSGLVEAKHYVVAVVLFNPVGKKTKGGAKSGKIVAETDTLDGLETALGPVHSEYAQYSRFFDEREQKTFYSIEDRETIVGSLSVKAEGDEFSIFYPLGMGAVALGEVLSPQTLDKIVAVATADPQLKQKLNPIAATVGFLKGKERLDMETVVRSYTMDGLYYMLNLYLRYGTSDSFNLFREYMFSLKGSMCELGKPVTSKGLKLYRGLRWDRKFLDEYKKRQGENVLLNAFVSTTQAKEVAMRFAKLGGKGDSSTLMEVRLVDFDDSFARFVSDFRFPEENGVFFPVDISAQSEFADESEVLFPPFYPVRVLEVSEEVINGETFDKIVVEAPYCVNIAGKDSTANYLKNVSKNQDWNKAYLDSITSLCKRRIIDKLSVVKLGILKYKDCLHDLLSAIKSAGCLRSMTIENESLDPYHAQMISADLFGMPTLRTLLLNFNELGDLGAATIARIIGTKECAIQTLSLQVNAIALSGAESLAVALKINQSLKVLDLTGNKLGDDGAAAIVQGTENNRTLEDLRLGNNGITTAGKILLGLDRNTGLKDLNVENNGLTLDEKNAIAVGLAINRASFMRRYNASVAHDNETDKPLTESMTTLDFSKNNGLAHCNPSKIGAVLGYDTVLRTLNLTCNSLTAEQFAYLPSLNFIT